MNNKTARDRSVQSDIIPVFDPTLSYEEKNELDNPGSVNKWQHILPFYAQNIIDLGFELPLPFTISLIPNLVSQTASFSDLGVQINHFDLGNIYDLDMVDFGEPEITSQSLQLRFAAWLFPFMEVSSYVGRFQGNSDLLITVPTAMFTRACQGIHLSPGRDPVPHGNIDIDPPNGCQNSIYLDRFSPSVKGSNLGINMNLVAGYRNYFVLLPISYTWSKTDDDNTASTSFMVAPRVGKSYKTLHWGVFSAYIGASYMDTSSLSQDTLTIDKGSMETLSYSIKQENNGKFASLVGLNWNITRNYGLTAEAQYGEERRGIFAILSYRY
ncbi:hypothetical protein L0B53_11980 [Vibrio sp. SS-MA-C1-2]|uniref:hypothetical protein n=1 Tax=Vibrio sp. SS-MA-C1-2 TaxID=2908646 RepID=UPI001F22B19E|nr:hypothetical protein [Vibrio sp. SS-MA-C1-2]UJF17748.1 hypothetical protein L0B53_11980 [Vibrio sp. SS-MA-C1-2]